MPNAANNWLCLLLLLLLLLHWVFAAFIETVAQLLIDRMQMPANRQTNIAGPVQVCKRAEMNDDGLVSRRVAALGTVAHRWLEKFYLLEIGHPFIRWTTSRRAAYRWTTGLICSLFYFLDNYHWFLTVTTCKQKWRIDFELLLWRIKWNGEDQSLLRITLRNHIPKF